MLWVVCLAFVASAWGTALDDYVNAPDPTFKWEQLSHKYEFAGAKGFLLNVTSQTWLTPADSSRSVWSHQVVVIVPDHIEFKTQAMLWITGGSDHQGPPSETSEDLLVTYTVAMETHQPAAALFQIPNEPITFPSDPEHKSRSEDAIIAYTWNHFLKNPNQPNWLLRLPMTKACVKTMDAVEQFLMKTQGFKPNTWLAAGASKRGWTTWTLAAVDKRIKAAVPIVMDLLNIRENLHHFWRAMGAWSFAFKDYWNQNLTAHLDDPVFTTMLDIVDPIAYKARYTMPMMIIDATDDEFFFPEDDRYWWGTLPGEKHRVMVQNAEHSLATGILEVLNSVICFAADILHDTPRPEITWTIDRATGNITASVVRGTPTKVTVRHAKSLQHPGGKIGRRDFRWIVAADSNDKCELPFIPIPGKKGNCIQPIIWTGIDLKPTTAGGKTYTYQAAMPSQPWEAYLIEFYFPSQHTKFQYRLTTQETIIPDTFPFPPCHGAGCKGHLV